jgi:hypothetical protein
LLLSPRLFSSVNLCRFLDRRGVRCWMSQSADQSAVSQSCAGSVRSRQSDCAGLLRKARDLGLILLLLLRVNGEPRR